MASVKECCKDFLDAVQKNSTKEEEATTQLKKLHTQLNSLTRQVAELRVASALDPTISNKTKINDLTVQKVEIERQVMSLYSARITLQKNGVELQTLADRCAKEDYDSEKSCSDPTLASKCCSSNNAPTTTSSSPVTPATGYRNTVSNATREPPPQGLVSQPLLDTAATSSRGTSNSTPLQLLSRQSTPPEGGGGGGNRATFVLGPSSPPIQASGKGPGGGNVVLISRTLKQ
jgi:hypothetical protein